VTRLSTALPPDLQKAIERRWEWREDKLGNVVRKNPSRRGRHSCSIARWDRHRDFKRLALVLNKKVWRLHRWSAEHEWIERARAYDNYFVDVRFAFRIREASKIAIRQERQAIDQGNRVSSQLLKQLSTIDSRYMSILEMIALIELCYRLRLWTRRLKDDSWDDQENISTPEPSKSWLQ
jgi:hypothetical protein